MSRSGPRYWPTFGKKTISLEELKGVLQARVGSTMRWRVLLGLLTVMFAARPAVAETTIGLFSCTTGENHERWALKTRPKRSSLASAKAVTLGDILGWAIPAGHTVADEAAILNLPRFNRHPISLESAIGVITQVSTKSGQGNPASPVFASAGSSLWAEDFHRQVRGRQFPMRLKPPVRREQTRWIVQAG